MKKLLGFVILFGFVIMLGAAGSADAANMSFVKVLFFETLGIVIVLSGTSALMHYKRYLRRNVRIRRKNVACSKIHCKMSRVEKELC